MSFHFSLLNYQGYGRAGRAEKIRALLLYVIYIIRPGIFPMYIYNELGPKFFDQILSLAQNKIFRSARTESPKIACSVSKVSSAIAKYLRLKFEKHERQPN